MSSPDISFNSPLVRRFFLLFCYLRAEEPRPYWWDVEGLVKGSEEEAVVARSGSRARFRNIYFSTPRL